MNKIISAHIYTHIIKIINYLQQTLPHSYMPYIKLGNTVKKLQLRLATFHYFKQIYKTRNWYIHILHLQTIFQ